MNADFFRWCAADRDFLLTSVQSWARYPSGSLLSICELLGYRLIETEWEHGQCGEVDFDQWAIFLNRKAYRKPRRDVGWINNTVAHELAHIRLHRERILAGELRSQEMEDEAEAYARIFLVPRRRLLTDQLMPQLQRATGRERANLSYRMATRWGVSPGLMHVRLVEVLAGLDTQPDTRGNRSTLIIPKGHRSSRTQVKHS